MKVVASKKFLGEFEEFAATHYDELRGLLEKLAKLEEKGAVHSVKRLSDADQPMYVLRHGSFRAFYTISENHVVLLSLARKG